MTEPRIVVHQVCKSFKKRNVLRDLDWVVPSGAVIGLLGVNGSGKSTLLRCILGLLKPTSGTITIDGKEVWDLPNETKARIGFVDQNPKLYPWMRGKHLLKYIGSFYPSWNEPMLVDLAARWDLQLDQSFGSMSPGQQQKLALLTALGNEPDLLILDEPVSSLDPLARREFLRSLLELAQDSDRTILFSTHITSDLERVASHVAILVDGQIGWFDELGDLKDRIKRWRIHSKQTLPRELAIPGLLHSRIEENTATVIVTDSTDEQVNEIANRLSSEIEVEDLNLEEIFLELHRSDLDIGETV